MWQIVVFVDICECKTLVFLLYFCFEVAAITWSWSSVVPDLHMEYIHVDPLNFWGRVHSMMSSTITVSCGSNIFATWALSLSSFPDRSHQCWQIAGWYLLWKRMKWMPFSFKKDASLCSFGKGNVYLLWSLMIDWISPAGTSRRKLTV